MPVDLRIDTEGNPETRTIDCTGLETQFSVDVFGRPKPLGIKIDPNNVILKSSTALRARAAIARSEEHTSELQSHSDLVCRLLLEKKNDFGNAGKKFSDRTVAI